MSLAGRPESSTESQGSKQPDEDHLAEAQESIGERIRFWEEQDKINQALIPRVIRQKERLDEHIDNHEDLSKTAAKAAREVLAEARVEQQRQHDRTVAHYREQLKRSTLVALVALSVSLTALILSVVLLVLSVL